MYAGYYLHQAMLPAALELLAYTELLSWLLKVSPMTSLLVSNQRNLFQATGLEALDSVPPQCDNFS